MNEKTNNTFLKKEDILQLMVEAFKNGCASYMDLAEDFCSQLLEEYIAEKIKTTTNVSVDVTPDKPAAKPFADIAMPFTQTSTILLNSPPSSGGFGGFVSIRGTDNNSLGFYNTLDFNTTTYYNNNNNNS